MVPLERTRREPGSGAAPGFGFRKPEVAPPPAPEPRRPLEFKVIDVMTRAVLAEHADALTTVKALEDVRSIVDVTIYLWDPKRERWRLLSFGETQALWAYRGRAEQLRPSPPVSLPG